MTSRSRVAAQSPLVSSRSCGRAMGIEIIDHVYNEVFGCGKIAGTSRWVESRIVRAAFVPAWVSQYDRARCRLATRRARRCVSFYATDVLSAGLAGNRDYRATAPERERCLQFVGGQRHASGEKNH